MELNGYTLRNVCAGTFFQDAVMARRVPFASLKADSTVDDQGREVLGANSLLISKGDMHILVFASMGGINLSPGQKTYHGLTTRDGQPGPNRIAELPEALQPLGLTSDDITHVVMTHLEYDHAAGLLDAAGEPYCHRATHIIREGELRYGLAGGPFGNFYPKTVLGRLSSLGNRLEAIHQDADYRLTEDIYLHLTGGHTPGHQVIIGPGFVHLGDLMHDEHVLGAGQFNVYARNMDAAAAAKTELLDQIVDRDVVVFFNHGHRYHAGRIRREGEAPRQKLVLDPVDLNAA